MYRYPFGILYKYPFGLFCENSVSLRSEQPTVVQQNSQLGATSFFVVLDVVHAAFKYFVENSRLTK